MNSNLLQILFQTAIGAALTVCFFGSFLLWMHSEQVRSRKLLATLMLCWGLIYLSVLINIIAGQGQVVSANRGVAAPFSLIVGNFAVIITTFYVVEIVRPGWLIWRRIFLWFTPFLILTAIYFIGLAVTGEGISSIPGLDELDDYIGQFNVWYRCILLLLCFGYLGAMLYVFIRHAADYRRWVGNHYANDEKMDISWIWIYHLGLLCMTVNYVASILTGLQSTLFSHLIVVIVFFSYINYKGLFHINPYPEGHFRKTMDEEAAEKEAEKGCETPESSLAARMEEYKAILDEWMRNKKPYLRSNFKLVEVAEVLPINRSYLSRLFNEGYNKSFSKVVRQYRIEQSKQLMQENPKLTQKEIARLAGFTSQEVFCRAFVKETGETPKQYAERVIAEQ